MKPQRIPWAFLLPIAELVLWSMLVLIPTLLMYGRFYSRKRLHWALRSVGLIFCGACIALVIGILTSPPADGSDLLPFMPGAIFWAVAFGLFPLNWILTARPRTNIDG